VSATWCIAVGHHFIGDDTNTQFVPLIERWNGRRWSQLASPLPSLRSELRDVSCVSRTFCVAVGGVTKNNEGRTLIESWNGHAWSIVPSPNLGTPTSVSCASPTWCTAVGIVGYTAIWTPALIASWNGEVWSLVDNTLIPEDEAVVLNSVSCVSAAWCMIAGYTVRNSRTFTASWNGNAWSVVPSADGSRGYNNLTSVSCVSRTSCKAVGSTFVMPKFGPHAFIESWNGRDWSLQTSPTTDGKAVIDLNDVSCAAVNSCQAVGSAIESYG
jgi:hypothetical protein